MLRSRPFLSIFPGKCSLSLGRGVDRAGAGLRWFSTADLVTLFHIAPALELDVRIVPSGAATILSRLA